MKLRSLRISRQPRLMIIPMIDVIFFLLVFFMMSTLYMVEQNLIPVNLPQAAVRQSDLPRTIAVTVTVDGRILFDQEEISAGLIQKRVKLALAQQPDQIFVLRSDKKAEYGSVITVLDEMKQAGVQRLVIATEQKGGE